MSLTAQAFGLAPAYHRGGGQIVANKYNILNNSGTGYGTAIYKGDRVTIDTGNNGTVEIGNGISETLGVFAGCEYIDATGKPVVSPYWPASTSVLPGSEIVAWVYDDPNIVYRVGTSGAGAADIAQDVILDQFDVDNVGTGSTSTGLSSSSITAAAVGNGATAQVRCVGLVDGVYNATTNPYPILYVQINQLQVAANAAVV